MRYKTIMADPPWPYKGNGVVGNGGRGSQNGKAKKIIQAGLKQHYPTMSIEKLKKLLPHTLVATNAHLYLWVTNHFLVEAHEICKCWGFTPKTLLTWGKVKKDDFTQPSMKTGYYFRGCTEHILFGVKGSLRTSNTPVRGTLHLIPRDSHSVKPDYFYDLIEQQSSGPYLEIFARRRRDGWDRFGNEVISNVKLND